MGKITRYSDQYERLLELLFIFGMMEEQIG